LLYFLCVSCIRWCLFSRLLGFYDGLGGRRIFFLVFLLEIVSEIVVNEETVVLICLLCDCWCLLLPEVIVKISSLWFFVEGVLFPVGKRIATIVPWIVLLIILLFIRLVLLHRSQDGSICFLLRVSGLLLCIVYECLFWLLLFVFLVLTNWEQLRLQLLHKFQHL
jgi:hypothetical protein